MVDLYVERDTTSLIIVQDADIGQLQRIRHFLIILASSDPEISGCSESAASGLNTLI